MQAAPPSPNILPDGTVLDDKFRILRCIGRGGMGAVYEIEHALTKHRRALKMLYPFVVQDRDAVDRFLLEASAAGTIDNPHIVETYDAGWLDSGEPYLVMELLEGESLDERLESEGRLQLAHALEVIAQAARAVHAAHEAGIVHRDLKPENIFLTTTDDLEIFVKVLDFGISKFESGSARTHATKAGAFMGTPQYMSPEQFLDGKRVDRRADVYSLGIMLFECVTGQHPYPCDTLAQLARKIMVEEVPPPSTVRQGVPSDLDVVLARALQKQPEERMATALDLAKALDEIRTGDKATIKQGSRWPSQLPPAREDMRKRTKKAAAPETVKVDPLPLDAAEPSPATAKTTLKSQSASDSAVVAEPRPATKGQTRVLAGISVAALAGAVVIFAWPEQPPQPSSPSGETAPSAELTGSVAPSIEHVGPRASASTPPRAHPSATASARTTASTTASAAAPLPSPGPTGVTSVPRPSQPKDYADVDEFPD